MKHLLLVTLLLAGCSIISRKSPNTNIPSEPDEPEVAREKKPVPKPAPTVGPLATKIKYRLTAPLEYKKLIPRVEKFFTLLVNDKSILNGVPFVATDHTADQIRARIELGFDVEITTYSPAFGKWRSVIAYQDDWVIYLSSSKLSRPECEIINTLAHESTHAMNYRHFDNYAAGEEMTVPYWVGNKAEEYCIMGKI